MLDSIDLALPQWDYCMECNISFRILLQRPRHTYNEYMEHRDHSIQLHFEIFLLYRCILRVEG